MKKIKSKKDCKYIVSTHKNATLDEKEWKKTEKRSSQIDSKYFKETDSDSDSLSKLSKRWN